MQNVLWRTKTYLAGPIESVTDAFSWREKVKAALRPIGIICFDPLNKPFTDSEPEGPDHTSYLKSLLVSKQFDLAREKVKKIVTEDLKQCDIVDFGIVYLPKGVQTVGTIHEIVALNTAKKPVFIVCPEGIEYIPLWIWGVINYKYFYPSLDNLIEELKAMDSGEKPLNSERWRLLKPEYR